EKTFTTVASTIEKSYATLKMLSPTDLVKKRMEKYLEMGEFKS
ncbi:MAG TPA: acetyl-CoA carboxylase carboxyl transferase subunit alpha, partial [Aequorivita sp.]|nr:acetyl-CoA carboxylase carboxyl transferase subunit alpha [Aequorivita sp.]